MDKKQIIMIVGGILAFIIVGVAIFFNVKSHNEKEETILSLEEEVDDLYWQVASFGDVVQVYTVSTTKRSGELFDNSDVDVMSLPSTQVTSQFVTNLEDIQNCIYKINVEPGMPLVSDIFFREVLAPTDRYYDVVSDIFPVSAIKGDYYDLRIVTPQGLDYIVLSKKRVIDFYETAVKMVLSEEEIHQYQSALVDVFLNPGTYMYVTTYVEPSMQKQASIYYPVSDVVRAVMEIDPNIVQLAESEMIARRRAAYESGLVVSDELAQGVIAGRTAQIGKLNSAAQAYLNAEPVQDTPSDGSSNASGMTSQDTGNIISNSNSGWTSSDTGSSNKTEASMQFDSSVPIVPDGLANEIANTPGVIYTD